MKENLKLLLVVTAGLIAGAMLHKCQSPPRQYPRLYGVCDRHVNRV